MPRVRKAPSLWTTMKFTYSNFAKITYNHGFAYTTSHSRITRYFWIIVLIIAIMAISFLSMAFLKRYRSSPIRVSTQTQTAPISLFRFPAITICNKNSIMDKQVEQLVEQLDPPESLPNMSKSFLREALYGLSEHTRVFNQSTLRLLDEILTYNRYEIAHIKDVLAQSCKDMLVRCRLEGIERDCSSMFDRSLSIYGYCCSFNIKANRAKPNFFGQQNGISVALNPEHQKRSIGTFFSEGMAVFVHHGNIYPNAVMQVILPVGRETLLAILPAYITSGADMSMLSFEDRRCLYDYEGSLEYFPKYQTLNCIEECKAKWYEELCECVPYFYANFPGVTVCNISQIPCLQKNLEKVVTAIRERHNLTYECVCPPQCDELNYDVRSTFGNLDATEVTIDRFYRDLNQSHVVLHAFFSKQVATVYERDLYFSWIDLIASIGGIFGLCVGGTCLSIIEVLYYGIGNFFCNYCRKKQEKSTIDKADITFEIKNRILTPS